MVTVSTPGLVHPAGYQPEWRAQLEAAATKGNATLYASGIEPGFAGDQLPLTLMTMSDTVRSVRIQEIFRYDGYPVTFVMFDVFGFGKPMEYQAIMSMPGVQSGSWGPPVRMIADRLGVELDEIRETYEKVVTPRTLEVAAGTIEAGTVGAVRFETIGVVDGRDAIVIEHVNRMAGDLAPEWPTAVTRRHVPDRGRGQPRPARASSPSGNPATASDDGMVATTMRLVNAIPYVCDAPAGLTSSLELPLTTPKHVFA